MNTYAAVNKWMLFLSFLGSFFSGAVHAQRSCTDGYHVEGLVTDPTGAVIVGASISAGESSHTVTDQRGHYDLLCVSPAARSITASAPGFSDGNKPLRVSQRGTLQVDIQLTLAKVQDEVEVGPDSPGLESDRSMGLVTLDAQRVKELADDPDDFLRELQSLAAAQGTDSASTIMVDGFRNPSAMPPKSSIASIRINPDIFSAEFSSPPWLGAVVQITTKPGTNGFHGAGFVTNSNGVFNATDPLSISATPAGKQRYGFELSGPVLAKRLDFALALEKRNIDEFNVVNATTLGPGNDLGPNGDGVPYQQSVSAPQRLWIASARTNWQVTPKDIAAISFSANVNNLGNQGIGGLVLPDAGYSSLTSEYDLRINNTLPINDTLLNETRVGYTWKRTMQTPLSTAPSLQLAGYFTSGGAASQRLNDRERDIELDDDVTATRGKHTLKFGIQSLGYCVHDYDPNTFNGAYVFGGGSAPVLDANNNPTGQTTTITALEQYHRAVSNLSGGTPTTYQLTTGSPVVPVTQWQFGLYAQDTVKVTPSLLVTAGVRYQPQTAPQSAREISPRVGLAWSPDKKQTWVFHARTGIFYAPTDLPYLVEVARLSGALQQQRTIYSPNYADPLALTTNSIEVGTQNQFASSLHQVPSFSLSLTADKDLGHHWMVHVWYLDVGVWGMLRLRNVNAPIVASSVGTAPDPNAALLAPRPITPNENIMQYENGGHFSGPLMGAGLSQNNYKRFGFTFNYKYENIRSDGGDTITSPQSSYSGQGEGSRVDWNKWNNVTFSGHVTLFYELQLAVIGDAKDGARYNIVTGTDNNGDGIFNDRPSAASVPGSGVYNTKFGLLTTNTVNGNVPRNLGVMPRTQHLDASLSRAFLLNPKDQARPRTLTLNARSANLLNHTNVTAVGTVASSSTFGQPLSAEHARRLEVGVRFDF